MADFVTNVTTALSAVTSSMSIFLEPFIYYFYYKRLSNFKNV